MAEYKINFLFTHQHAQHELLLFDDINLNNRKDFPTDAPIIITTPIQSHTELTPQTYATNNYHYANSDQNLQVKSNKTKKLKNILSKPLEHYTFPGNHIQLAQGQTNTNDRILTDRQKMFLIKYVLNIEKYSTKIIVRDYHLTGENLRKIEKCVKVLETFHIIYVFFAIYPRGSRQLPRVLAISV